MTDVNTNTRDWRKHLTPEERREVAILDKIIEDFTIPRAVTKARQHRQRIQNRASVRAGRATNGR